MELLCNRYSHAPTTNRRLVVQVIVDSYVYPRLLTIPFSFIQNFLLTFLFSLTVTQK